jgi:acetone carboxylase gamma subunit
MIPSLSMKTLIEHYGSYAHGTIKKQGLITKDNIENNDYEYCLRPKFNINDALWKELNRYICYEEQLIYKLEGYNGEKEYS